MIRARVLSPICASIALATFGCFGGRGANQLSTGGVRILASSGHDDDQAGVSGLVAATAAMEWVADEEPIAISARSELAIGGNVDGVAGKAHLDVSGGVAVGKLHAAHARVGFDAMVEGNAYNGFRYLELPTLAVGYTFHGQGTSDFFDTMHFHVGPRLGLALTGGVEDGYDGFTFGPSPDLGAELTLAGEAFWYDMRYRALVGPTRIDVFEARACFALFLSLCVDTRHMGLPGAPSRGPTTSYVGVAFGFGLSTGHELD